MYAALMFGGGTNGGRLKADNRVLQAKYGDVRPFFAGFHVPIGGRQIRNVPQNRNRSGSPHMSVRPADANN